MMLPYTIRCMNCDETRIAWKRQNGIEPFRRTCPSCGCPEFESLI